MLARENGGTVMAFSLGNGSLLVLAITAFACARAVFVVIADPEGPNLLVVAVLAVLLFLVSAGFYVSRLLPALAGIGRAAAALVLQAAIAAGLALMLR